MFTRFKLWMSKKEIPKLSKIETTAIVYKTFKPECLENVFSSDMSIVKVQVQELSIELYGKLLSKLIQSFKEEKQIFKNDIKDQSTTIFLRDFFLDRNQNFLDARQHMQIFALLAAEFLEIYQVHENILDPSFIIQSNLRLSRPIVTNLISLIESLKVYEH